MNDLEKQLMDLSGIEDPEKVAVPKPPSVVNDVDYGQKAHVEQLRTFNSDLADAIRTQGGSVVRVAIAEEEKHRREYEDASIKSKKNISFIVIGLVLVLGGVGAVIWSYKYRQASSVVAPAVNVVPDSIVPSDEAETIDATGMQTADFYVAVQAILKNPRIQPGQIANIVITRNVSGTVTRTAVGDLLKTLGMHLPDDLNLALQKDFMLGTYLNGTQNNLFFVIHGTAHDYLLSGMLEWEPYLFTDMVPLFNIDTSSLTPAQLQNMTFASAVIGNQDARAVVAADGTPLLYYAFLDPNTILIATDPKTLTQVISRFQE